ncbi:MAG: hypothetical protein ACRDK2_00665 [Solirubrobacteraceae bacterium]
MDTKVIVMFALLHGTAMALGTVMMVVAARGGQERCPDDSEDFGGDGGQPPGPRPTPEPRGGGLPLPDAQPARVRLREPVHRGGLWVHPPRRRPREAHPARDSETTRG